MLSKAQIIQRLHDLYDYSFVHYIEQISACEHRVALRKKLEPFSLRQIEYPTVEYIVREMPNYLLAWELPPTKAVFILK